MDESCLSDPRLLNDLFMLSRQSILEMKMLGQDHQLSKRQTVTNLLHFVHNHLSELEVQKELEMLSSLLDNKRFAPTSQDGKQYVHAYFEWKLLLALIALKSQVAVDSLKDLCVEIFSYSVNILGVSSA